MLWAPAVVCEISAPPTTPRGVSRSGPGLTTLMAASLRGGMGLDLQGWLRRRLVVDLQGGVADAEAVAHLLLEDPAQLMAVVAGAHDDVGRQRRKARGDLPHVQVVDLRSEEH